MDTNETPGLKVTYPYTTSPDVARYQCAECGGWERSDKDDGEIHHSKRCDSRPQSPAVAAALGARAAKARTSYLERVIGDSELTYPQLLKQCKFASHTVRECLGVLLATHRIERVSQGGCLSIYRKA